MRDAWRARDGRFDPEVIPDCQPGCIYVQFAAPGLSRLVTGRVRAQVAVCAATRLVSKGAGGQEMNARSLGCVAILWTVASAAHAATYTEIWNPPEARTHAALRHGGHIAAHSLSPRLAKKVIVPAATPTKPAASATQPQKRHDPPVLHPRIGPDGRPMQV
jgi:hypothetical protein